MWNKVELRKKDKNLPDNNTRVLWTTNEGSLSKNVFHSFIGELTTDKKYIDTGIKRYKLTSNYWWLDIPSPPKLD